MTEFLHRTRRVPAGATLLLPSPLAALLADGEGVRLFGPHARVWRLEARRDGELWLCTPNLLKVLFGHPRRFLDRAFSDAELPLLTLFRQLGPQRWPELLADARAAVPPQGDEQLYLDDLGRLAADGRCASPLSTRQRERIFLRYGGWPPARTAQVLRLSKQLSADVAHGRHVPGGGYADQSHFIRECRRLTGRPPGYWARVGGDICSWDGEGS